MYKTNLFAAGLLGNREGVNVFCLLLVKPGSTRLHANKMSNKNETVMFLFG